jgi:cytochrome c-type biogenesis protein CcmH/NrfF
MKKRALAVIPLLFVLLVLASACASTETIAATLSPITLKGLDAVTLVEERCTVCHSLNRIQTARYSAADWKTVVDTMITRGAQLSPEEESVVVDWLVANYGP